MSMGEQLLLGARQLANSAVRNAGHAPTSVALFAIQQLGNAVLGLCDVVEAQQRELEALRVAPHPPSNSAGGVKAGGRSEKKPA